MQYVQYLIFILVFPGLLFTLVTSLLILGIDEKVLSIIQHRRGRSIFQPFYDLIKLMGKKPQYPERMSIYTYLAAPAAYFAAMLLAAILLPAFGFTGFSGSADLLVIMFLLYVPVLCKALGSCASGVEYTQKAESEMAEELLGILLPLAIVFLAVARAAGGKSFCFEFSGIWTWQSITGCGITHIAMIPTAVSFLLITAMMTGTRAFDRSENKTWHFGKRFVKYTGISLGLFKLGDAVRIFVMSTLFTVLFLGGITTGILIADIGIYLAVVLAFSVIGAVILPWILSFIGAERRMRICEAAAAVLAVAGMILVWLRV